MIDLRYKDKPNDRPLIDVRLAELSKIEARALRYSKKDLITLLDKQSDAEFERDRFVSVIANHKWRMGLRNRSACEEA